MNRIFSYLIVTLLLLSSVSSSYATLFEVNNTIQQKSILESGGDVSIPQFSVQVLKYEPYPVNPGDWFDLWIDVKNVGQNDAPDTQFEFVPVYPFTTNDTITRDYGRIGGTVTAFNNKQADEQLGMANQIVTKFRIKVADNAPEGTNFVKFMIFPDKNDPRSAYVYQLPVIVGKTRTEFEVLMQDSTDQGTSFSIVNTGQNAATAIVMSIKDQEGITVSGARSSIIGNLDKGDFTTQTFKVTSSKNIDQIAVDIAYTDSSGVRNMVEKMVPVNLVKTAGATAAARRTTTSFFSISWFSLIIGLFSGFIAELLIQRMRKK